MRVLLSLPVKSPQRGVSETSKHSPMETQTLMVMASTTSVDCCTSQRLRRPGPCFQARLACPKGILSLAWKSRVCKSSLTGTWTRAVGWSGKSLRGQWREACQDSPWVDGGDVCLPLACPWCYILLLCTLRAFFRADVRGNCPWLQKAPVKSSMSRVHSMAPPKLFCLSHLACLRIEDKSHLISWSSGLGPQNTHGTDFTLIWKLFTLS